MENDRKKMEIPLIRPFMPKQEDYCKEISSLWETRSLTNMAPKHQQLERELKTYLDAAHLQLFANGHGALECLLQAFDLKGEVITTPFTFASTIHAIVRSGLKPVFCDIRQDDFTMDVSKVEELITERTVALLPVHVYGMACDVERLQQIADRHGLKVIYDAAHAFGVRVKGRGIASFGDASMFSLHATKIYHTVEGGAVAFREESLARKRAAIRDFGLTSTETVDYVGCNSKMDEFRAAMGLCNLRQIDEILQQRKKAGEQYDQRLSGLKQIQILPQQKEVTRNYAYYPIVLQKSPLSREDLQRSLAQHGVHTRKYFYPLCCDFSCYRETFGAVEVPVARYVSEHVLCLPMYYGITEEEIDFICDLIQELVTTCGKRGCWQ